MKFWGVVQWSRPIEGEELDQIREAADFVGFSGYTFAGDKLAIDTEDEELMKSFFAYLSFILSENRATGRGAIMSSDAGAPGYKHYYIYNHDHLGVVLDDPDHLKLYKAITRSSGFALFHNELAAFKTVRVSELDTV